MLYSTGATVAGYGTEDVTGYLIFAFYRFASDSLFHACTAGIAAYFVGLGVLYRALAPPLVALGVGLVAVAHWLFDYFAFRRGDVGGRARRGADRARVSLLRRLLARDRRGAGGPARGTAGSLNASWRKNRLGFVQSMTPAEGDL